MTFLPTDYKIPKMPGNYMRFEEGLNRFRVLSSAIVGYEYFTKENKPVRQKEAFDEMPEDIKKDGKIKPFWAFVVYNYDLKMVQILEVTQKTIMFAMQALIKNDKWGMPQRYDIAITKSGEGLETEYNVQGEPPLGEPSEEVKASHLAKYVNLEALYEGADPFTH